MLTQLKIFEIIMLCTLAKSLNVKAINEIQNGRFKRGYSNYGENGKLHFESSAHVSSGVLQYNNDNNDDNHAINSDADDINVGHISSVDSSLDASLLSAHNSGKLESSASHTDTWTASGLSSGFEVWLEPLTNTHSTSASDSSSIHTTLADDTTAHAAYSVVPSSQLHTKIASSSSIGHSAADIGDSVHSHAALAVRDNIDFNNIADIPVKHYAKSYGK